jgi:hypothetical protein
MSKRRWLTDAQGKEWLVHVAQGHLRFECSAEARYLRAGDYPDSWSSASDAELERLLDRATRHTVSGLVPCRLHFTDGSEREHVVPNPAPDAINVKDKLGSVRRFQRRALASRDGVVHYFETA